MRLLGRESGRDREWGRNRGGGGRLGDSGDRFRKHGRFRALAGREQRAPTHQGEGDQEHGNGEAERRAVPPGGPLAGSVFGGLDHGSSRPFVFLMIRHDRGRKSLPEKNKKEEKRAAFAAQGKGMPNGGDKEEDTTAVVFFFWRNASQGRQIKKRKKRHMSCLSFPGAGDEARTRYLHLGKVALYQMSYTCKRRITLYAIPALMSRENVKNARLRKK